MNNWIGQWEKEESRTMLRFLLEAPKWIEDREPKNVSLQRKFMHLIK